MSRKDADFQADNKKDEIGMISSFGDPYENRTRVTAVKGPCLNRLTNGPPVWKTLGGVICDGSGRWIRTADTAGMNRML